MRHAETEPSRNPAAGIYKFILRSRALQADNGTITLPADELPPRTTVVQFTIELDGYVAKRGRFVSHRRLMNDTQRQVPMSLPVLLPSSQEGLDTVKSLRIVLKWGEHPRDLDLHCVTSKPVPISRTGTGEEEDVEHEDMEEIVVSNHMYFRSSGGDGEMRLDRDDQDGNCHETLTIAHLRPDVSYWFGAHHFGGEGNFAISNATLEVYGLTPNILATCNFDGADTSPFTMAVPRKEVEGCGEGDVWQGFCLTPNGTGGFTLRVANKLLENTKVGADETYPYIFD